MAVPLRYNLRHLGRRWRTSVMTVIAIGLVVAIFVSMLSLAQGLADSFVATGDPRNVLVLRKGSTAETNSTIDREAVKVLPFTEGLAKSPTGEPIMAPETINIVAMPKAAGGSSNGIVRGVGPSSLAMRPGAPLIEGRMFNPGVRELIVGKSASKRFANAKLGDRIRLVRSEYTIVGIFDAGRTAFDSEFWGDVEELNSEFNRSLYSSVLLQAESVAARDRMIEAIKGSQRLSNLDARAEVAYYAEQTKSAAPIRFLGMLVASVMAVGAVFAAMNTMYASISGRAAEIATLRILGFSRRSILLSFVIESVLIGLAGGVLGGLMALPMNGYATGTTNLVTFSEVAFAFRVTPALLAAGLLFSAVLGLLGGFLPALQASRRPILESLREG